MVDIDLAAGDRARIGMEVDGRVWLEHPGEVTRVSAADLRGVAQRVSSARDDRPGLPVLVDIHVMIATDARTARAAMPGAAPSGDDTLLYVGTPSGLAGLVTDIHALGIADGAVFIPLNGAVGAGLITSEVLPRLRFDVPQWAPMSGAHSA